MAHDRTVIVTGAGSARGIGRETCLQLAAAGWNVAFAGRGVRIVPIALPDEFLAAGALPTLHDRYGISTDAVVARVKAELGGGSASQG